MKYPLATVYLLAVSSAVSYSSTKEVSSEGLGAHEFDVDQRHATHHSKQWPLYVKQDLGPDKGSGQDLRPRYSSKAWTEAQQRAERATERARLVREAREARERENRERMERLRAAAERAKTRKQKRQQEGLPGGNGQA